MVQNNVHVFVMDNFGYRRVSIHDVIYLEASRNYCVIHLVDKSKITVSVPMCEVQEYFSPICSFVFNVPISSIWNTYPGILVILCA